MQCWREISFGNHSATAGLGSASQQLFRPVKKGGDLRGVIQAALREIFRAATLAWVVLESLAQQAAHITRKPPCLRKRDVSGCLACEQRSHLAFRNERSGEEP